MRQLYIVFACVLGTCYLAQLAGPLRLDGDSPTYLCDASDLADGRGFRDNHLPRGYPHVLATLDLMGLGSSAGFVAVNLVGMGMGLVCISTVLRREFELSRGEVEVICLLTCCSWVWVHLVAVPMSDLLFFALSSMVLALLSLAKGCSRFRAVVSIGAAALIALAAFFVRTIGAALFVAVAFAVMDTGVVRRTFRRRLAIVLLTISVCVGGFVGLFYRDLLASRYYSWALSYLLTPPPDVSEEGASSIHLLSVAWWRIGEVGAIAQNVSAAAFAPTAPTLPVDSLTLSILLMPELRGLRQAVGIVSVILIFAGLWSRRRRFSHVEAYLTAYVGILLIWPYEDTRFFAPVIPLLLAFAWLGLRSLNPQPRTLARFVSIYAAAFCLFGAVAMGDSLRTAFFYPERASRESWRYVGSLPAQQAAFDRYGGTRPSR